MTRQPDPFEFFEHLKWLDGRPLVDTIEPYRRAIFREALYTFDADGHPRYTMALCGRAKKNYKTSDLCLAALYKFIAWESSAGNDCYILANDEDQAGDDLSLIKKLITANPPLARMVNVQRTLISRMDGRGTLEILPARDAVGAHGKTYLFCGFDEIHGYRSHDLFEALAPDPSRRDCFVWITSYAGLRHAPGIPLYDFMAAAKAGTDPRLYFSWYSGDFTTDPAAAVLEPEARANPSMATWGNSGYLEQQRARLPTHKYRRLHLNLPGAPDGAALSAEHVLAAIMRQRRSLPPVSGVQYRAFVDMSGGSADDAVLSVAHLDSATKRVVVDCVVSQSGEPPFNPRKAIEKFGAILKAYRVARVVGDAYAGETFRADFQSLGIAYETAKRSKSDLYEALEVALNAGEVELLDIPKLQEQLLTLVWRGGRIDHQSGDHDDFANAAAGAVWVARSRLPMKITPETLATFSRPAQPALHMMG